MTNIPQTTHHRIVTALRKEIKSMREAGNLTPVGDRRDLEQKLGQLASEKTSLGSHPSPMILASASFSALLFPTRRAIRSLSQPVARIRPIAS